MHVCINTFFGLLLVYFTSSIMIFARIVTRTRDAILFVIGRSEFEGGWSMCRHFMQRSGRESSVEKGVVNRYAWVLIVWAHISPCPTIYCVEFGKILHFSCWWIFICSTLLLPLFVSAIWLIRFCACHILCCSIILIMYCNWNFDYLFVLLLIAIIK